MTDSLSGLTDTTLYPGLCRGTAEGKCAPLADVGKALKRTSVALARYGRHLATVRSALTADWGAVVGQVVASVRVTLDDACRTDPRCSKIIDKLSRYSGLFAALVNESDPSKVADALDAAAMPIGGWRQKQVPGITMVTLSSLAGFSFGGVEWRWGQYGVHREQGHDVHWIFPVLQLPIGVDVTWGWPSGKGSSGLFVSLLDPAAYLQYDPDEQGRLPGAQLLTALAPGVAARTSICNSPFVASLYGVFRPNFRAWDPAVTAPAAHAVQVGVSLSVDVTLFEIYTYQRR